MRLCLVTPVVTSSPSSQASLVLVEKSPSSSSHVSSPSSLLEYHLFLLHHRVQFLPTICQPQPPHQKMKSKGILKPLVSDKFFRHGPKLGSYKQGDSTLYTLIEKCADSCDFGSIEKIFDRMKRENRVFREKNFIFVFKAYGKARLPELAVGLFDRMGGEFQCTPTVRSFNSVLNVIVQDGQSRRALDFYSHVVDKVNITANVLTFNLIIKANCKLGLVDKAIELFRDMPLRNCSPDKYTYCTLMDGLCKEGRIDEAISLLDEMQIDGCFPNPIAFNVLISGLCKMGDMARTAKLVENMHFKGCKPTVVTYNTLIHGLCLKGNLDKAISLLEKMVSDKCLPNDVTYGAIINGLVKQKTVDGVRLLISMEERGHQPNQFVYSSILDGLFKEGRPGEAIKLWKEMIERGLKLNTIIYTVVIDGLCQEGKVEDANSILSEMIDGGLTPNSYTYSSILKGYFKIGYIHKALLLWEELKNSTSMHSVVLYTVLLDGLSKAGKLDDAIMIWKYMVDGGHKPDVIAYSSLIHGFCKAGLVDKGLKFLNQMLSEGPKSQPDVVTYNILFKGLCESNRIATAIDLLNQMLDHNCDPDLHTCHIFLMTLREKLQPPQDGRQFLDELVVRLCKRHRGLAASKILHLMLQKYLPPKASTWELVLQKCCRSKKVLGAIEACWCSLHD